MNTLREMTENVLKYTAESYTAVAKELMTQQTVFVHAFDISDVIDAEATITTANREKIRALAADIAGKLRRHQNQSIANIKNDNNNINIKDSSSDSSSTMNSSVPPLSSASASATIAAGKLTALPLLQKAFAHQFPMSCRGKKATVLKSFQETG